MSCLLRLEGSLRHGLRKETVIFEVEKLRHREAKDADGGLHWEERRLAVAKFEYLEFTSWKPLVLGPYFVPTLLRFFAECCW